MFDRFTEKAIKSILLAQEETRRLCWKYVGTEMILLGVLGENTGEAAEALKAQGITYKQVLAAVREISGCGPGEVSGQIPFTPRAKRVLHLAWSESELSTKKVVNTGHLLLGIIREAQENLADDPEMRAGIALRVFASIGVDLVALREAVLSRMDQA